MKAAKRMLLSAYLAARRALLSPAGAALARRIPPSPRRILLLRLDRLGDLALSTALFPALAARFRGAELHVACAPGVAPLLLGHPALARVLSPRSTGAADLLRFALALRRGGYDLVLDLALSRDAAASLVARAAGPCAGFAAYGKDALFDLPVPDPGFGAPFVDTLYRLLAPFGYDGPVHAPRVAVLPREREEADRLLAAAGVRGPFALVHPGGHYPSQRHPHLAEAARRIAEAGHPVLAVASPGEADLLRPFAALSHPLVASRPVDGLRPLMALLSRCAVFLGNNSGPLHVAAALSRPTVSTLGPTRPAHFAPHGPGHTVLRLGLPCSPCDRADCADHGCLRGILPGTLAAAVLARLAEPPAGPGRPAA